MEVTINYGGQLVSVEVSIEVYEFLDCADHNEWHSPYPQLAGEVRAAVSDLAAQYNRLHHLLRIFSR